MKASGSALATLAALAILACDPAAKTPPAHHGLAGMEYSTGSDPHARVAWLDLKSWTEGRDPLSAVKAFLVVAHQHRNETFDRFELRWKGETRYVFSRTDALELARRHATGDSSATLLRDTLDRARSATREPAAAFPKRAVASHAGLVRALVLDLERFVGGWLRPERDAR
jgi:hypothetical protein